MDIDTLIRYCKIIQSLGRVRRIQSIGEKHRTVEEHPCTDLELIEEVVSDSWLLCYSLCMCIECYGHEYLLPVMNVLLVCCVCDFMVELKSERVSE
jgi:hypothetical protein